MERDAKTGRVPPPGAPGTLVSAAPCVGCLLPPSLLVPDCSDLPDYRGSQGLCPWPHPMPAPQLYEKQVETMQQQLDLVGVG